MSSENDRLGYAATHMSLLQRTAKARSLLSQSHGPPEAREHAWKLQPVNTAAYQHLH